MMSFLKTPCLRLRETTVADLDFLAAMLGDAEVMRFYSKVYARDEARGWLDRQLWRFATYGHGYWLVEARTSGQPPGQVGLIMQELNGQHEREISYMIHRPYWRQGYAIDAALAVRRHAFEDRGHDHVISLIRPENLPSHDVARKLDMSVRCETMHHGLLHLMFCVTKKAAMANPS